MSARVLKLGSTHRESVLGPRDLEEEDDITGQRISILTSHN